MHDVPDHLQNIKEELSLSGLGFDHHTLAKDQ